MSMLLRRLASIALALPLYTLLLGLGLLSLVWNLIAMLLYPVLPPETATTPRPTAEVIAK